MSKLSIKVVVAGRTYPLTVNEGEQDRVQKAVDDINKSIQLLQENYAVKDMQDLLAMTALQLASKGGGSKPIHSTDSSAVDYSEIEQKLEALLKELE